MNLDARKQHTPERGEFRVPVCLHAALEINGTSVRVLVRDLSTTGYSVAIDRARVSLDVPPRGLARGAATVVRIPTTDGVLELPGRVAWTKAVALESSEVLIAGIRLDDLSDEARATLRAWLLHGLSALRDAARYAVEGRWERASSALHEIGFENVSQSVLAGVLRYTANMSA